MLRAMLDSTPGRPASQFDVKDATTKNTMFHLAAMNGHQQIVTHLRAVGMFPHYRNLLGLTYSEVATGECKTDKPQVLKTTTRKAARKKVKPNAPCPCKSGKKYKKCCKK